MKISLLKNFLYETIFVDDLSIEEYRLRSTFYKMRSSLMVLLQENIIVDHVSLWKDDRWWCFYFKTSLLMKLLYTKYKLIHEKKIVYYLPRHLWRVFRRKYRCLKNFLYETIFVDEHSIVEDHLRSIIIYKKLILDGVPIFKRHCWRCLYTQNSPLMTFIN